MFTGGVGEHAFELRAGVVAALDHLGVQIDPARNDGAQHDGVISAHGSSAVIVVVTAREDLEIARQVRHIL